MTILYTISRCLVFQIHWIPQRWPPNTRWLTRPQHHLWKAFDKSCIWCSMNMYAIYIYRYLCTCTCMCICYMLYVLCYMLYDVICFILYVICDMWYVYVYVIICVCVYVCVCVSMYVCMYVHVQYIYIYQLQEEQSLCFLKAWPNIHLGQRRITFPSPFRVAGVGRSIITRF